MTSLKGYNAVKGKYCEFLLNVFSYLSVDTGSLRNGRTVLLTSFLD